MNMLKSAKSPYLLQHADNPVNWYPWCDEAFERAAKEDKPIFLSIGYSTCHWCHVMAEESFEDEIVAEILNRDYISIKVDREERPDIDSVYMTVCNTLNGSGGWPLTVIMTPEQKPFFAGTYIPRDSSGERMGLTMLLTAIASKWQTEREALLKTSEEVSAFVSKEKKVPYKKPDGDFLKDAADQLAASFDKEYGGFGGGMKFPMAPSLLFLLKYAHLSENRELRRIVDFSIQQMYRGGIFDHIGGGFSRYSTDREWLVPHFEKTLYDNALLAMVYTEAWEDGHYAVYRDAAEKTLDYCLRELRDENGGFYCGQDADSDGIEGGYYLLIPEEISTVLGEIDGKHFCECYDITKEGNFGSASIPNLLINQRWTMLPELEVQREKLREYRSKRMELKTDRKQLFSWNALMLSALSKAYCAFGDRRYLEAADKLREFLAGFKGAACCIDGEFSGEASLDGHCFCALALMEHYKTGFDAADLTKAKLEAECIVNNFADKAGYFDSSVNAEKLIIRPKSVYDNAMPSGNSAAAVVFDRMFRLSGEAKWKELRDRQLRFICGYSDSYPAGCAYALTALMGSTYNTRELVCVCEKLIPSALYAVTEKYAPELTVLVKTADNAEMLAAFAPFTSGMKPLDGKAAFYVCGNNTCLPPIPVE